MQQQEMELRAEAARANAPAVRPVGRLCMGPATRPAPAPKRQVDRFSASTHVQAPPAELARRLLVLVQLSAHTDSLTLLLFLVVTSIPAIKPAVQEREAAARQQSSRFGCAWKYSGTDGDSKSRGDPEQVQLQQ
eukprot:1153110-Pelagomonas_calceolata.AAC.1